VTAPIQSDAWLTIRLTKRDREPQIPVRFHALIKDSLVDWARIGTLSDEPRIALRIRRKQWSSDQTADVLVRVLADQGSGMGRTIRGSVVEAVLRFYPEVLSDH
jgi:hypothetical protein